MEPMFPKELTHSKMGKKKTSSMFVETAKPGDNPFLTLGSNKKYISLRDLFIKYVTDDPSEVSFAEIVFGEYDFWLNLSECKWLEDHVTQWRRITDARRKAKAFSAIVQEIDNDGRNAFAAAKYLIQEPWKDKRDPKVKKDSEETTKEAYREFHGDIDRLKESGLLQ